MKRVVLYSALLVAGLIGSQVLPLWLAGAWPAVHEVVRVATMVALAFIMIHVGREFEIDRSKPRLYLVDYGVAATAAAFPWVFVSAYFVFVLTPSVDWGHWRTWTDALLSGRFASPTSAGVLFSMLAAAGLSATWMFRKARVLAIFDDLDTVLLMIPLKMMIVGPRWQLAVIVVLMAALLWAAWRYLHQIRLPTRWPAVLSYSALIVAVTEAIYIGSKYIDDVVPIHVEVLLPAFVLGCVLAHPEKHRGPHDEAVEGHVGDRGEQTAATLISGSFMVLVGLSMPAVAGSDAVGASWGVIARDVLVVTLLSNLGKMFPALVYRREATLRERLAVSIGMWPRGEVGAGVLVLAISYSVSTRMITVAALSLALNLILTGVFIAWVKRLVLPGPVPEPAQAASLRSRRDYVRV